MSHNTNSDQAFEVMSDLAFFAVLVDAVNLLLIHTSVN